MNKQRTGGESRTDHRSGGQGSSERDGVRGAVHSFVEVAELRVQLAVADPPEVLDRPSSGLADLVAVALLQGQEAEDRHS